MTKKDSTSTEKSKGQAKEKQNAALQDIRVIDCFQSTAVRHHTKVQNVQPAWRLGVPVSDYALSNQISQAQTGLPTPSTPP